MTTPTVRRLQLGHELRHFRETAGLDLDQAGKLIGKTNSTMSRIERGLSGLPHHVLKKLLNSYDELVPKMIDKDWVLELARGSQERGRWSGYRSIYHKYFRMGADLEEDASAIYHYQTEIVPGLLQTERYLRALYTADQLEDADIPVEDAINARLERQEVLTKKKAPKIGFVLSESAIRRMIGSPKVMHEQLHQLLKVTHYKNVQLQVLPFRSETAPRTSYNFQLFRVPSAGISGPLEFVYLEDYTDGRYLDDHDEVAAYTGFWQQLTGAALGPVESHQLILAVADEYEELM